MEIENSGDGASVTITNKEKEEYGGVIGSIHISSLENSESSVVDLTGLVHQLPCCIKHDGPSSVSQYFKPNKSGIVMENGISVEETHFRGRKLQGANIPLPQGYSGYVLGKKKKPIKRKTCEEEDRDSWETCARFQSITYWNHDNIPSQDDVLLRSFHWFKIANALHAPVPIDDLASVPNLSC
ncbi:hypothetical protein C5167_011452 [Papaver somniferum]|uniref:Uncharacterized protein n=1 Tax=Papaver somniferum TaxID=3469 RepID=A0A4Y7K6C2_PAPSO|nr:ribonuclease H2 subunit C-like [Papaver somniferum]RZC67761.1 hypothetical protein C5167_011452 [Papaver somniferum]